MNAWICLGAEAQASQEVGLLLELLLEGAAGGCGQETDGPWWDRSPHPRSCRCHIGQERRSQTEVAAVAERPCQDAWSRGGRGGEDVCLMQGEDSSVPSGPRAGHFPDVTPFGPHSRPTEQDLSLEPILYEKEPRLGEVRGGEGRASAAAAHGPGGG